MAMHEIVPGVFVTTDYPPYNLTLIKTEEGAIVIDLPPRPSHLAMWLEQATDIGGQIRYVILTDARPERQLAAAQCSLPMVSSEAALRAMASWEERPWREFLQDAATRYPEEAELISALKPRTPSMACAGRLFFHIKTPPIEVEAIEGAAVGSLWLYIPDAGVLVSGDTVTVDEPLPLEHTPDSKAWLNTLAALSRRTSVRTIIPGRGRAPLSRADLEPQRELLRVMRRTARSLARHPTNGGKLSRAAMDLGQTLFNQSGQNAVKHIKAGLTHLINEMLAEQASDGATEEE